MTSGFRLTLLCALAVCASGCSSPRRDAEKRLKEVGADRVREEAAVLYKDIFAARSTAFVTLKVNDCPATFRAFSPERVIAYRDGFGLSLSRNAKTDSGLYIVPAHMDVSPNPGRRARFDLITPGIYWYSFEP